MKTRASNRHLSIGILLLCILCGTVTSWAESLKLRSRQFFPPADVITEWNALRSSAVETAVHTLIQLDQPLTPEQLSRLNSAGIELHAPIPTYGFLASIPSTLTSSDLSSLDIRYVGEIFADDKIHPRLKEGRFGDWSVYTQDRRIIAVSFFKDISPDILSIAAEFDAEIGPHIQSTHTWIMAVSPDYIFDLASLDEVKWIEELPPPMTTTNDQARIRTHAEQAQAPPYNLSGDGVVVCVYDGGMVDQSHSDFGGRVTFLEGGGTASHATHVAGSVGSSGQLNGGLYRGMAPEVEILSYEYEACIPYCLYNSPQDIEENYEEALNDYGAHLCTNSIGSNIASNLYDCDWEGDYEITSQLLDEIVTGSLGDPFVILYAAGNERGPGTCGTGYGTLGVPAGAKNIIAVGATDDNDLISSFTSWGPPDDGRLKPDISAPGVNIYSTLPGNGYGNMSGTSMATPVTAGCVALMMEKFHLMFSTTYRPLPSTVKAILCVSADDLGNPGPDYQFGHGRVNVENAVSYIEQFGFMEGEIAQAETISTTIQIAAGLSELQVVLAWDDPAAVPLSVTTLINDLDLRILSPTLTEYLPATLNPSNPGSPASAGRNSADNVENTAISNPATGEWTLQVIAYDIPGPQLTQAYSLASNLPLLTGIGTISGVLTDSATGSPLQGWVEVSGGPQVANANASGQYSLYLPGDSTYTLIANQYGYSAREATVYLPTGGTVTQDFALPAGSVGYVTGHVTNQFGQPLDSALVEVLNTPLAPVVTDPTGAYSLTLPGGDTYDLRASYRGFETEESVFVVEDSTVTQDFTITIPWMYPTGPDNYGYIAYDNYEGEDPAVYDWVEIDPDSGGLGTVITLEDDETVPVALPFTFRYYGVEYDTLSICSNGWVACGFTTDNDWSNTPIPDPDGPPAMIAPFWEDLLPWETGSPPATEGTIAYWYDQANDRFIVEYDHVQQWAPESAVETFEVILYDPIAYPTITGDGNILFQYKVVADPSEIGVGIENHTETDGLQLLNDGVYDSTAWPIESGLAILFTTGEVVGLGSIAGQVTLHPTADPTQVVVTASGQSTNPLSDGTYQLDMVPVGTTSATATLTEYENGIATGFEVFLDSLTENVDFEMWHLDPPTNLQADRDVNVVTLWWDTPWALDGRNSWFNGSERPVTNSTRGNSNTKSTNIATSSRNSGNSGGGSPGLSLETFNLYRNDVVVQSGITDTVTIDTLPSYFVYDYYLTAVYTGGESDTSNNVTVIYPPSGVDDDPLALFPKDFFLSQNYPNPFNPVTRIKFGLPAAAPMTMKVFNILGQQVATLIDEVMPAGYHQISWHAGTLSSGLYFVVMEAENRVWIQKGLLLK